MYHMKIKHIIFILLTPFVFFSCSEDDDEKPTTENTGKIALQFIHQVNGRPLIADSMMYTNAAGNHYLITEVQYFISDLKLHRNNAEDILIDDWQDIWYVDNDIPSTQIWNISDKIPVGNYDSISFTFGISEEKNQSLMFINPPERDMFWPEFLGGGYHYLKLNGKWQNDGMDKNRPFEFHLGIGQIYKNDSAYVPDIIGFVQNHFRVKLPINDLEIETDKSLQLKLIMEIQNWFQNPFIYNHADYAQNTMQSQEAMHKGCMNGKENVFRIEKRQEE